jgi:hypothetical protein
MVGMSYLDEIAQAIEREIPRDLWPEEDAATLFRLYALLLQVKDHDVTDEDVHDAWAAWMLGNNPRHPAIRPFAELAPEIRAADRPYADAIRRVAFAIRSRD